MRDLGLPNGPNPGKQLLEAATDALAAWDMATYEAVRKQVVERQGEICAAGGEHLLLPANNVAAVSGPLVVQMCSLVLARAVEQPTCIPVTALPAATSHMRSHPVMCD